MHFGRLVARAGGVIAKMATAHAPMAGAIRSVPCADAAGPRRANIRVLTAGDRPGGPDAATAPRWRCPQYLLTRIGDSGCSGTPVRPAGGPASGTPPGLDGSRDRCPAAAEF